MFDHIPTINTYRTEIGSLMYISTFTIYKDNYKCSTVVMHGRDLHELGRYTSGNFNISNLDQLNDHNTFVSESFKKMLEIEK